MNNTRILNLINENKIDELKKLVLEEINKKEGGKQYKALMKLAKLAEKEQRSHKLPDGSYSYIRPNVAGAYFLNGKTMITSGYWGIVVDNYITGLVEAQCSPENALNLNQFFKENGTPVVLDMYELTEKAKSKIKIENDMSAKSIRLNGELYNAEYVYNILQAFDDYKIYTFGTHMLQIESGDRKALVMGIRERK